MLPPNEWVRYNLSNNNFLISDRVPWSFLFCYASWFIWKWKNRQVFEEGFVWHDHASNVIFASYRDYKKFGHVETLQCLKHVSFITCRYPPQDFVKVNMDIAAKSNHGDLIVGGLFLDSSGSWLLGFIGRVGWGHITKAEIYAIFCGLKLA